MNHVADLLALKMIETARTTMVDCGDATLGRIDYREMGRTLAGIIRCHVAGRISEEEALLFARAHWALAALKAVRVKGARS